MVENKWKHIFWIYLQTSENEKNEYLNMLLFANVGSDVA